MHQPCRLPERVAAAQLDRADDAVRRGVDHGEQALPGRRKVAAAVEALEAHEEPVGDERHLIHLGEAVGVG